MFTLRITSQKEHGNSSEHIYDPLPFDKAEMVWLSLQSISRLILTSNTLASSQLGVEQGGVLVVAVGLVGGCRGVWPGEWNCGQ